jgi:flagellar basal body-associated protein FliL
VAEEEGEEELQEETGGEEAAEKTPAEAVPKAALIIPAVHSLALLGALGFMVYSKLIYKHPVITDAGEKARIIAQKDTSDESTGESAAIPFGPLVVNIMSSPDNMYPTSPNSPQIKGRMHYLSTAFVLEVRDKEQSELVKSLKPFILDKLIQLVGKKHFHELATVQGRYILHSQLVDMANQTIAGRARLETKEQVVTNLYFTSFMVQ